MTQSRRNLFFVLLILLTRSGFVFISFVHHDFTTENQSTWSINKIIIWRTNKLSNFLQLSPNSHLTWSSETDKSTIADSEILLSTWSINPTTLRISWWYSGSQQLSLDDIVTSITDPTTLNEETTAALQREYQQTRDPSTAIKLLTQLTQHYNYKEAYSIFQELSNSTIKSMDPYLVMRILFNSQLVDYQTKDLNTINNMIAEFSANSLISQQDTQWYHSILLLLEWKKEEFIAQLPIYTENNNSDLAYFTKDLRQKIAQSTQWNDIPQEYSDGMIALGLFQYGYPYVAEEFSLRILQNHPNYILPKQILAYSNMILHNWRSSQSYFLQLIEQDPGNESSYQFFAGICAYRLWEYTDAVLYLDQIPQEKRSSDNIRYKLLSYLALKDRKNVAKSFQSLLDSDDIKNSDIILAREQMVFLPYLTNQSYDILINNKNLLDYYSTVCEGKNIDKTICDIGKLADSVVRNTIVFSENQLKDLVRSFPKSYIYVLLWEYYLQAWDIKSAQKSYISALSLTSDPLIKQTITNKIKALL